MKNKLSKLSKIKSKLNVEISKLCSDEVLNSIIEYDESYDHRKIIRYLNNLKSYDNFVDNWKKFVDYLKSKKIIHTDHMYDVQLNALKYNITVEESKKFIDDRKSSKATSLKKFIERHGEELGRQKFEQFRKTSALSMANINALGAEKAKKIHRSNSRRCFEFYLKKGLASTQEEAESMALEYQLGNSGVHKKHWRLKGLDEKSIEEKFIEINAKQAFGYKQYKEKYPDTWKERVYQRWEKYRKTINAIPKDQLKLLESYYAEVMKHTKLSTIAYADKIPNLQLRGKDYHLDHKYSIKMGFIHNIDPAVIGHWSNLEVLPAIKNCSKGSKCSISLETLFEIIEKEKHEN